MNKLPIIFSILLYSLLGNGSYRVDKENFNLDNYINLYISERNCITCYSNVGIQLKENNLIIDSVFIAYTCPNKWSKENIEHKISATYRRHLKDSIIYIYGCIIGDVFDYGSHTNFVNKYINSLYFESSPILFSVTNDSATILRSQ